DPDGSRSKFAKVQVTGTVHASLQTGPNSCEVVLDARPAEPAKTSSEEDDLWKMIDQLAQAPKTIVCSFPTSSSVAGQVIIEGDFSEHFRQGNGGIIRLINCRLVK